MVENKFLARVSAPTWRRDHKSGPPAAVPQRRNTKDARSSRFRTCARRVARASRKFASAAVWAPSSARPLAPATRDRSHAAVILAVVVLKAARTRCIAACPSAAFTIRFGVTYSVLNLADLNVFPAGETVTPELASRPRLHSPQDRQDQSSRRRRTDREDHGSRPRLQPVRQR